MTSCGHHKHKLILFLLSFLMMFLSTCVDAENQAQLVEDSIHHAKEAITLDVKDGNSWCMTLILSSVLLFHKSSTQSATICYFYFFFFKWIFVISNLHFHF